MSGDTLVYRIADEPRLSRLSRVVVNPFIILLLSMLLMFELGTVWLLFNGFAMGSPYARRNLLVTLGAVVVFFAAYVGASVGLGVTEGGANLEYAPYFRLAVRTFWILVCYYLFMSQMKIYPLFQYYRQQQTAYSGRG